MFALNGRLLSMVSRKLLCLTKAGLYCEQGDFYIDPWRRVDRAVITHAHSDHARWGMGSYLCSREGLGPARARLVDMEIDAMEYGVTQTINGVRLSLHPAGHILGSAQVRLEYQGEVAVVSGDYKVAPDRTCTPVEPLKCHVFVTESTFGLPIYRWPDQAVVARQINAWWRANQAAGKASLLMGYSLGKAQRLLACLDPSIGPIFEHGAVATMTTIYRKTGIAMPETQNVMTVGSRYDWSQAMIVAPPSANGSPWTRRFGDHSTAFASGWMAIRGARRRSALDRGFVLSDHVDWPSLLEAIHQTEAEQVWITHGYSAVVARYLQERGIDGRILTTEFGGEEEPPVQEGEPEVESEAVQ